MAIDGITVLNTHTVNFFYEFSGLLLLLGIFGAIASLLMLVTGFMEDESKYKVCGILIGIVATISIMGAIATQTHETHYQVILDDSVSMNEFYQHYRVIQIDGLIYTITPIQEDTN